MTITNEDSPQSLRQVESQEGPRMHRVGKVDGLRRAALIGLALLGGCAPESAVTEPVIKATAPIVEPAALPDLKVRRTRRQAEPPPALIDPDPTEAEASPPGRSLALEAALTGALTGNPDLVALRQDAPATAEAVEVARRFPTSLNPTLWLDIRPLVYARGHDQKDGFLNVSWRQPIELGHQTTHRHALALAAYDLARWQIVQAEVLTLVQTYRAFQAAAYRREKWELAGRLVGFNRRLVQSLRAGLDENLVQAADVRLAEVELRALRQQVEAARQDYDSALADLRNQLGQPEAIAEPGGAFALPEAIPSLSDAQLVAEALHHRPEIHAARARVRAASAAVRLACGDRIPTIVVGPEYQRNEVGTDFYGFVAAIPLPTLNNGTPLVRQRQAEYRRACVALRQVEQRTVAQMRAAVAKWNAARRLVAATASATRELGGLVADLEGLFEENQVDVIRLLQGRQRLIQLENAALDATWQAAQAQADVLAALGTPNLFPNGRRR